MLTDKELRVKQIMEGMFIPALHKILRDADPQKYDQWQGNACRQTAVFGVALLRLLLPEYTWSAWDGDFDDIVHGEPRQYNHAWIYGVNRNAGRRLLVDLSRQHHERLFILTEGNRYPKDHPAYVNMKELRRGKMDVDYLLSEDEEFYTQLLGRDVFDKIVVLMGGKL